MRNLELKCKAFILTNKNSTKQKSIKKVESFKMFMYSTKITKIF